MPGGCEEGERVIYQIAGGSELLDRTSAAVSVGGSLVEGFGGCWEGCVDGLVIFGEEMCVVVVEEGGAQFEKIEVTARAADRPATCFPDSPCLPLLCRHRIPVTC